MLPSADNRGMQPARPLGPLTPEHRLTLDVYLGAYEMGYERYLSTEMRRNAEWTIKVANQLILRLIAVGVPIPRGEIMTSGWRPPPINAQTKGAARNSLHLTCEAIDINDPDGDIDDWLSSPDGQMALEEMGIWIEHPATTRRWSHWQTCPPRSGRRMFYP